MSKYFSFAIFWKSRNQPDQARLRNQKVHLEQPRTVKGRQNWVDSHAGGSEIGQQTNWQVVSVKTI